MIGDKIPHSWDHDWQDVEVILEFNGPQLAIVQSSGVEYLSVASDEDSEVTRWLRSRISHTEKRSLYLGYTTVLDCILKPEIWVVDTDADGIVKNEVKVAPESLRWTDLPSADSVLPLEITNSYLKTIKQTASPSIIIDGLGESRKPSFKVLSDILQSLQKVWTAIAQVVSDNILGPVQRTIAQRSEMLLANVFPSSFGLSIESTDNNLFQRIAEKYRNLVLASSDKVKLKTLLAELKPPVRESYSDYLDKLKKHSVEILAQWSDGGAFISPSTAARVEPVLARTEKDNDVTLTMQGYFKGYNLKTKKFLFISTEDVEYVGKVSKQVLRDESVRITISSSVIYEVQLSTTTVTAVGSEPKDKHELVKASQVTS